MSETRQVRYGKSHSHRKNSSMWEDHEAENICHIEGNKRTSVWLHKRKGGVKGTGVGLAMQSPVNHHEGLV